MIPCPQCKPGEFQAAMAVGGPSKPTDEEIDAALEKVLKALGCEDPVVGGVPVVLASTKNHKPEDHLLDMNHMDEKWFEARKNLRKAIADMLWADQCSWW